MIEGVLIGSISLLLGIWIALPVFYPRGGEDLSTETRLDELIESKHAVYRSILDLEFDYRVGKVSGEDYPILRRQHEAEALAILRDIDQTASPEAMIDVIEAEVAAARRRLRGE